MRVFRAVLGVAGAMMIWGTASVWSQSAGQPPPAGGPPPQAAKTVATVNGAFIDDAKLEEALDGIRRQMARQGQMVPDAALTQMRADVLDHLIGEELLYQDSRRQGVNVDEQAILEEVDAMRQGFENAEAFNAALSAAGMSLDQLTDRLWRQDAIQQLIEARIVPQVTVSDVQADEFYRDHPDLFTRPEQVRARHILVRAEKDAAAEVRQAARQRLAQIRQEAQAGADFATLAQTHSEDPGSREKGGDLGFFGRGRMVKAFEEAAFTLPPNQISEPVETEYGYHLIQVTERQAAETVGLETVKPRILEHLKQQRIRERVEGYVEDLRKGAKIEKFL